MTATQIAATRLLGYATVAELAAELHGAVIRPGDDAYDQARALWNGAQDQHPALIVRCAGVADVIAAAAGRRLTREPSGMRRCYRSA